MNLEKIAILNRFLSVKGYQLVYDDGCLSLNSVTSAYKPLVIDFTSGKSRHRRLYGGGVSQVLAKAVGIKSGLKPDVLDLTAGLGKDAFVLATLGCQVRMIERSPVIASLLEHALLQAANDDDVNTITARMQLIEADSLTYLENLPVSQQPQVVYLDPMYPHREKTALVKKEMRIFRDLVGDDPDADRLFAIGRSKALKRLVVKRPKGAGFLAGEKPSFQIASKNTRYDCYLPS